MAARPSNPREKAKPKKGGKPVAAKKPVKPLAKKAPAKRKAIAGTSKVAAAHRIKLFIAAYLSNGGNATQAAITAGYSVKTAKMAGSRLMTRDDVKAAVAEKHQKIAAKFELTLERTLQEIARLAYSDPRRLYNADGTLKKIHELDDDTAATIASVEQDEIVAGESVIGTTRKLKQWDKNSALEKAMKFHGAYEKDNAQKQSVILQVTPTDEAL